MGATTSYHEVLVRSKGRFGTIARAPMTSLWQRIFPRRVCVFADFIDPFSYIGFHNLVQAAQRHGVLIEWRGFEFNPDTPEEGYQLQTASNSDLRPGMWASVRGFARQAGLDFPEPQKICKTALAHRLVQSLPDNEQKILLISKIYQAYFNENSDLARQEVLGKIVEEMGCPADAIDRAIEQTSTDALERFRKEALSLGFLGLPGFHYRGQKHFGALPVTAWDTIFQTS
jgi:predicted DsbA family dithiol-disulfide isomerase